MKNCGCHRFLQTLINAVTILLKTIVAVTVSFIEDRIHFRISYKKIVRNFMSIYYQKYIVKRKKFAEYFEVVLHFHIREKK